MFIISFFVLLSFIFEKLCFKKTEKVFEWVEKTKFFFFILVLNKPTQKLK